MPGNTIEFIVRLRDQFTKGMGRMRGALNRFAAGLNTLQGALGGFALARVMGDAVRVMAGFEQSMNRVQAITGATAREFAALRGQARQLGATTQYTASEAADAMGFLAMAGFNATKIIGAMPATLNLAAAAQLDMGQAADIVSNVMQGFSLRAAETTHAADVLTKAFTSSNTNLQQLGEGLKYAGPVAKSAGISFEETAAAVGLLGNAGIQGSMAGTTLRGAIAKLLAPSHEAAKILKDLGVQVTDSAGRMLPLVNVVAQLKAAGISTAQAMEVFGLRAGPGMMVLLEQGSEALEKMTDRLKESGGTAARIAKVQMKGLAGEVRKLKSAWQELMLQLGDAGVLTAITGLARGLTFWIREISTRAATLRVVWARWMLQIAQSQKWLLSFVGAGDHMNKAIRQLEGDLVKAVEAMNEAGPAVGKLAEGLDELNNKKPPSVDPALKAKLEQARAAAAEQMRLLEEEASFKQAWLKQQLADQKAADDAQRAESQRLMDEELSFRRAWLAQQLADQQAALQRTADQNALARTVAFEAMTDEFARRRITEQAEFAQRMATAEGNYSLEQTLRAEHQRKLTEIDTAEQRARLLAASASAERYAQIFSGFAALARAGGANTFKFWKALAYGEAIISTYAAANRALASAPPPLNFALAAAVIAKGLANVAIISAQKPPAAHGGLDFVPKEQTFLLDRGERVLSPRQNEDLTRFLNGAGAPAGGQAPIIVQKLEVHILENATNADALMRMDERDLREVLATRIYDAMNSLDRQGVRPNFAQRGRGQS